MNQSGLPHRNFSSSRNISQLVKRSNIDIFPLYNIIENRTLQMQISEKYRKSACEIGRFSASRKMSKLRES